MSTNEVEANLRHVNLSLNLKGQQFFYRQNLSCCLNTLIVLCFLFFILFFSFFFQIGNDNDFYIECKNSLRVTLNFNGSNFKNNFEIFKVSS